MHEHCQNDTESGYVLATTAILLVPLLVFTAFVVDVGGWYNQATRQQSAADAAALAAVVWMPDLAVATQVAQEVAAENGFPPYHQQVDASGTPMFDAGGNPVYDLSRPYATVSVDATSGHGLSVSITADGETYFGQILGDQTTTIERRATAEYVLPVPLGNPSSALGTGPLATPSGVAQNVWLAVNGYCANRNQGDTYSVRWQGAGWSCNGNGTENPLYDPDGYYLVIDMPPGSEAYDWNVQFYEPGVCSSIEDINRSGPRLQAALYAADNTPLSDLDNVTPANLVASTTFSKSSCSGWASFATIPSSGLRGRWILNYRSRAVPSESGMNYFGVQVVPTTGPNAGQVCATSGSSWCPSVTAREHLPLYANASSPGPAVFHLAEIAEIHAGKTLELTLFDPGEGMANMQILAPDLSRLPFTWTTIDCTEYGICTTPQQSGSSSSPLCFTDAATDTVTPVSGDYDCLVVYDPAVPSGRFQGQTVRIKLDLPEDYTCSLDCWWRVRYEPRSSARVTDRTTWSVRVVGDPVRLVE